MASVRSVAWPLASAPLRRRACRLSTLARASPAPSPSPSPAPAAGPPLRAFHLSVPTHDLSAARAFYCGALGCREGRSSSRWVDFDLLGHQVVLHLVEAWDGAAAASEVDGDPVPVPHFGVCLGSFGEVDDLAARAEAAGAALASRPHTRFEGQPGEQRTFFLFDPSNNALEFKAMRDPAALFARYDVDTAAGGAGSER